MRKTERGFVNIHIDINTKRLYISNHPYPSKEAADGGVLIGYGIEKVGCFEIEYTNPTVN